jgi:hypothetical protein
VLESLVGPWPLLAMRAGPEATVMGADAVAGAVLALPPRLNDSRGLLAQICHGRPLMGGYLARIPPYPLTSYPSATRGLWHAEAPVPDIIPLSAAAELASLGVRFVALDLTELSRRDQRHLATWLDAPGISRISVGDERAVYAVDPAYAAPAPVLGAGWYELEQDGQRRWRWMGERAELTLLSRVQAAVALTLRATAYGGPRLLEVRQGAALLARVEVPGAPLDRTLSLRLLLAPGATPLTLMSPAEATPDGRRLSLSIEEVSLASLPVAAGWAAERSLALPVGAPAPAGAPCR